MDRTKTKAIRQPKSAHGVRDVQAQAKKPAAAPVPADPQILALLQALADGQAKQSAALDQVVERISTRLDTQDKAIAALKNALETNEKKQDEAFGKKLQAALKPITAELDKQGAAHDKTLLALDGRIDLLFGEEGTYTERFAVLEENLGLIHGVVGEMRASTDWEAAVSAFGDVRDEIGEMLGQVEDARKKLAALNVDVDKKIDKLAAQSSRLEDAVGNIETAAGALDRQVAMAREGITNAINKFGREASETRREQTDLYMQQLADVREEHVRTESKRVAVAEAGMISVEKRFLKLLDGIEIALSALGTAIKTADKKEAELKDGIAAAQPFVGATKQLLAEFRDSIVPLADDDREGSKP